MKASEQKRAEAFELTGAKTSTLTRQVVNLKEKMENEYISIYNKMDEEKLKIQQNMAIFNDDTAANLEEDETHNMDHFKIHVLEIMKLAGIVYNNRLYFPK